MDKTLKTQHTERMKWLNCTTTKVSLKPNGISHTVMPEDPAKDYNAWMEHITAKSIERDADLFKKQFDSLWAWTYFEDGGAADDFKKKYDTLWADFKKQIQNHAK